MLAVGKKKRVGRMLKSFLHFALNKKRLKITLFKDIVLTINNPRSRIVDKRTKQYIQEYYSRNIHTILTPLQADKRVLIVEINTCHAEVLPSIIYYFRKCGYAVDILLSIETKDFWYTAINTSDEMIRICMSTIDKIEAFLEKQALSQYEKVFFTTDIYYKTLKSFLQYYVELNTDCASNIISYVHDKKDYDESLRKAEHTLCLYPYLEDEHYRALAPVYFGKEALAKKLSLSSPITISVFGSIEQERRSYETLLIAMQHLSEQEMNNFQINIVGNNDTAYGEHIYSRLKNNKAIQFIGRSSVEVMQALCMQAPYMLFLLDTPLQEQYLWKKSTGSLGLCFGFGIVPIITKNIAMRLGLPFEACVIYEDGKDLANVLSTLHTISNEQYQEMVKILRNEQKILLEQGIDVINDIEKIAHTVGI